MAGVRATPKVVEAFLEPRCGSGDIIAALAYVRNSEWTLTEPFMPNRADARDHAPGRRLKPEIINAIFYVVELRGDFSRATCRPHRLSWFSPMARRRSAGPGTTPRPPWVFRCVASVMLLTKAGSTLKNFGPYSEPKPGSCTD